MAKKEISIDEAINVIENETISVEDAATEVGISGMYLRRLMSQKVVTPKIKNVMGRIRLLRNELSEITAQRAERAATKAEESAAKKATKLEEQAAKAANTVGGVSYNLSQLRTQSREAGLRISGRNKAELAAALEEYRANSPELNIEVGLTEEDLNLTEINLDGVELPDILLDT